MWWLNPQARRAFDTAIGHRDDLEASGFDDGVIRRIQRDKLDLLWDRAASVPYYRALPQLAARRLDALPVTGRDVLKARPHDFLYDGAGAAVKYYESSGSSGRPTPTPRLVEDIIHNVVGVSVLWRRVLGDAPSRVASLLPSDVVPVGDFVAGACEFLGHQMLRAYPFSTGMCDWDRLAALFGAYRPERMFAAPGVLAQWTRILKTRGTLAEVRASVATVLLLGEVSLPAQRRKLAIDWQAEVVDASYGSTETGTIAAACERGGMHLLSHGHVVELRRGDEVAPATPGATGELVDTTLNNYARPLLRYGTGDVVDVHADPCPCGLPLPAIAVQGRGADQVLLRHTLLSEHLVGSVVYQDVRVTGYLMQLRADGSKGRLVLERDIDATGPDEDLVGASRRRFAEIGVEWDDIVVVSQLPASTKSGGSQKSWKRTNLVTVP